MIDGGELADQGEAGAPLGELIPASALVRKKPGPKPGWRGPSKKQQLGRKHMGPRSKTLSKRITRAELELGRVMFPPVDEPRPTTRSDCEAGINDQRPCPWVGCSHHLYLEITEAGSIKIVFPDKEPWELAETCSLDVADRDGATLEEVGALMNFTRERTRQIEVSALMKTKLIAPHPDGDEMKGPRP